MERQDYQGRMEEQLSTLGRKIDEMTGNAKSLAGEAREEYNKNNVMLRVQMGNVQQQLEQLKNTSGSAWEDVKKGVDSAWDEVQESLKRATSRFQ